MLSDRSKPGPPAPRGPLLQEVCLDFPSSLIRPQLPVRTPLPNFPIYGYTESLAIRARLGWDPDLPPFTAVPFHHAILFDPGGSDDCNCPALRRRYQPSPVLQGLGTLIPAVRSGFLLTQVRAGDGFEAQSVRFRYGLVDCSPPGRTDLGSLPAAETFTPELASGELPPPDVGYGCRADWAVCAGRTFTGWNSGLLGRTQNPIRVQAARV